MNIRISQPLCFSEQGQKDNQEDALFPHQGDATVHSSVLMVCDGMGGHEHGEVASRCVADTIGDYLSTTPSCSVASMRVQFEAALTKTYQTLDELDNSTSPRKMGTTLTFLAICTDGILIAHIGDSRVYQMRRKEGVVFQTHDHSLLNELIASGELDEEGANHFGQKNVITRAVMPHQEYPSKATFKVVTDIREGDIFFLCSDGIVEQIDNKDLTRILLEDAPLQNRLDLLKSECEKRNTRDNHSCYAFEVEKAEGTVVKNEAATENKTVYNHIPPRLRRFLLWALAALILVIAFSMWMGRNHGNRKEQIQKSEQVPNVQGPITRDKKIK